MNLRPLTGCALVARAQVDTMIVQAIGLLDDLDKELNTYAMRVREWYGWHFPEMTRVVSDNIQYALVVRPSTLLLCFESHAQSSDVAQSCIPARCGMLGTAPLAPNAWARASSSEHQVLLNVNRVVAA